MEYMDEFKKALVENLFCATETKELSVERIFEIVDDIAPYVLKEAEQYRIKEVWHDASEEPDDMSHCLIFYGDNDFIGHYLHYEPVLYNKKKQEFVTAQRPHPTGYKVEQKSLDGACVAEVYKDRRDRFSISDIGKWCYLDDISPK